MRRSSASEGRQLEPDDLSPIELDHPTPDSLPRSSKSDGRASQLVSAVRYNDGSGDVSHAEEKGAFKEEDAESVEDWFTLAAFPQWCRHQEKRRLSGERREGGTAPWKQGGKMMRRLFLEAADREDGGMREVEVVEKRMLWLSRG